jgi:formylglycine-generating enzyme required for sulfatase activity
MRVKSLKIVFMLFFVLGSVSLYSQSPQKICGVDTKIGISFCEIIGTHNTASVFEMGSNKNSDKGELGKFTKDERPVHQIELSKFDIGKHEVTQAEWQDVMKDIKGIDDDLYNPFNGYLDKFQSPYKPAISVSYYDAYSFLIRVNNITIDEIKTNAAELELDINNLGVGFVSHSIIPNNTDGGNEAVTLIDYILQKRYDEGKAVYRLPTEAEHEYVAQTGGNTNIDFNVDEYDKYENIYNKLSDSDKKLIGNKKDSDIYKKYLKYEDMLKKVAWFYDEKLKEKNGLHEVGELAENAYGVNDILGNVWEWNSDWYGEDYYSKSKSVDPKGSETGSRRAMRGGGWFNHARGCRSAYRDGGWPGSSGYFDLGFRLVRTKK